MAATTEAARLTEAYRLAQARLGAGLVLQLRRVWSLLDPADLDGTFADWLAVVTPLIQAQRGASSAMAGNYLVAFRALELGVGGRFSPTLAGRADPKAIATSMLVTGPASIRSALGRSVPPDRALETAQARSSAAAMRHALNGGRETIIETARGDRRMIGWARATSGQPCAFCAMLASRGPVYGADVVEFKAHDHCTCSPEPVYRDDAEWPRGSRRLRELWDDSTEGLSGDDATKAFRRALSA